MYTIRPSTRDRWQRTLEKEYGIEESDATTLVDVIVGDPRVSLARPQSEADLKAVVDRVGTIIDEVSLADVGEIDDPDRLRETLVGILRIDLGLDEPGQRGPEQGRVGTTLASQGPDVDPDGEPPARLEPFVREFVSRIESEESAFEYEDLREIVQWVSVEMRDQANE